jgi:hypothetical protein
LSKEAHKEAYGLKDCCDGVTLLSGVWAVLIKPSEEKCAAIVRCADTGVSIATIQGKSHFDSFDRPYQAKKVTALPTYKFSNVPVEGDTREEATEKLLRKTFEKALALLKREFGAAARFEINHDHDSVDFFWRKAGLALRIAGPLGPGPQVRGAYRDNGRKMRDLGGLNYDLARAMGISEETCSMNLAQTREKVHLVTVPYYMIWRNPQKFLNEVRTLLLNTRAYPRLLPRHT